jgi:hypothetical protein
LTIWWLIMFVQICVGSEISKHVTLKCLFPLRLERVYLLTYYVVVDPADISNATIFLFLWTYFVSCKTKLYLERICVPPKCSLLLTHFQCCPICCYFHCYHLALFVSQSCVMN